MMEISYQYMFATKFTIVAMVALGLLVVERSQEDTEEHVDHTQNYGHLHFQRVGVYDQVVRHLPNGVESEWIGIAYKHAGVVRGATEGVKLSVDGKIQRAIVIQRVPRGTEHIGGLREDIIVDETGVD